MMSEQKDPTTASPVQMKMDKHEPISSLWLERLIYLSIGILLGLILGIGYRDTEGFGFGMMIGIGIVIGFYVFQSLTYFLWEAWGWIGKVLAACMLGPGVGLVILGIGDLIRFVAYQLYRGDKPVFFAFFGQRSKFDNPESTNGIPGLPLSVEELSSPQEQGTLSMRLPELTQEEREVLALLAEGLPNLDIADKLDISPIQAKLTTSELLTKFKVESTAELVNQATQKGYIPPS